MPNLTFFQSFIPKIFFSTKVGSLHNKEDRQEAARMVKKGKVIGVFNRGVNALWLNAQDNKALDTLYKIKGNERKNRPVALTISLDQIANMVDFGKISDEVRKFLELSSDLKSILGSLCFIRLPIKKEYLSRIPEAALSFADNDTPRIQIWDPHGHPPTEDLIMEIQKLGVNFPAVTSMNYTGQTELVDQDDGEEFCKKAKIDTYLRDNLHPKSSVLGSYTIISLSNLGVELTRDGNISAKIIEQILGVKFITEKAQASKYPQIDFPDALIANLSPKAMRLAVLLYLEGKDPVKVNKYLKFIKN